jgi:hypothetical protein
LATNSRRRPHHALLGGYCGRVQVHKRERERERERETTFTILLTVLLSAIWLVWIEDDAPPVDALRARDVASRYSELTAVFQQACDTLQRLACGPQRQPR